MRISDWSSDVCSSDLLKGAAAKFASIAQDQSLAESFRDLALIRQTAAEYDSLKPDVVISRLRGLAVKGGRGSAAPAKWSRSPIFARAGAISRVICSGRSPPPSTSPNRSVNVRFRCRAL